MSLSGLIWKIPDGCRVWVVWTPQLSYNVPVHELNEEYAVTSNSEPEVTPSAIIDLFKYNNTKVKIAIYV